MTTLIKSTPVPAVKSRVDAGGNQPSAIVRFYLIQIQKGN